MIHGKNGNGKRATENWATEKWATVKNGNGNLSNHLRKMGNGKMGLYCSMSPDTLQPI